ncbi:molybdopterin oxidoreductase family protein [Alkalimarinus coralli]|uniref:molybdopterin oxidoreductase family protein n=1 Tax=Alkalimarinus coralli TaxID=2935863 RepID=UPI00202AEDB4|nr:molybdopterin oxidoreductase family protein [Alkalimarinus coralli]
MNKNKEIKTHYRTCNLCEAMCGIEIKHQEGEILSIKGDKQDPLSHGHICPKAIALKDLHVDKDRLKHPMQKTENGWKRISWQKAFNLCAEQIKKTQREFGRDSVGVYLGNPSVHNHGTLLTALPFLKALRSKKRFSATSNDQLPHMLVNLHLFGHQGLFPIPDIDHTDLFICLGSNPVASNGSLMSAPGIQKRIKAIQDRDGKVVIIDPRKTETAHIADEHLFIKPGTDCLLLLAMLQSLFAEGLVDIGRLERYCDDQDLIKSACEDFTPENVSEHTGIAAETIRELARRLATTPRAVLFGRMGTSTQAFGGVTTWLIYLLNILTGHLDQRGGMMFTKPAADVIEVGALAGQKGHFNRYQSRVRGLPEFSGELPASTMAEEILTPGEGQIRSMITIAGNPVISSPNGRKLEEAFESLDFMVSIDFYLNETTCHANLILPPTGPLEHSHFDIAFNMISVRNTAKYSEALFEPEPDTRHDWQIFMELTRRLEAKDLRSRVEAEAKYQILSRIGADGLLDILLRFGPYGTRLPATDRIGSFLSEISQDLLKPHHPLRRLLAMGPYGSANRSLQKELSLNSLASYPHGIDLGPLQPCFPERIFHKDQRIPLAPDLFIDDLTRVREAIDSIASGHPLLLIGRRHVRSNNSWLHNSHRLIKGKNRCTLIIHPNDAKQLKLNDGGLAKVTSNVGSIDIPVEISEEIMPGVVSIPHGWGHHRQGTLLSVAETKPGVSLNDITDDQHVDALSGVSVLNGVPVTVKAVQSKKKTVRKRKKASAEAV